MKEDMQQQLIRDLVGESIEALDQFDQDLLAIESGDSDQETLHRIFRAIHSLKGTSGCLGLKRIEKLSHAGENLLSLVREGRIDPSGDVLAALFGFGDTLRGLLATLESTGSEGEGDQEEIIASLHSLQLSALSESALDPQAAGLFADEPELAGPPPAESTSPSPRETAESAARGANQNAATPEGAIRVNVEQLDALMDLVGELVLARNQILQYAGDSQETALVSATQRLNIITTRLQESVMKTRMQPIGNLWSKYPRVVRDLAHELGKQVSLVMEGVDTELDRSILEAIKDPLTHLVRNAIDHGLERPEDRSAAGKAVQGVLRLRAFHEGGQVIIEMRDDGAGVNRSRVISRAVERGLVRAEDADRMSEREIYSLLFLPGFSTAAQITNVSGRGVGMDVVKQNIEKIGGAVSIHSEPGRSTTVRIQIPLTLAIIPALIIRCAGLRFAIPQGSLTELVRIDGEQRAAIEYVNSYPVFRLRGNLLPLVDLREQLELGASKINGDTSLFLLVLQAEGRQFGLVVDSILDTEEIVVKPLGRELKQLSVYAGATIMGDGSVALILDVMGLARRAHLLRDQGSSRDRGESRGAGASQNRSLLLISMGENSQAAMELSSVARLEEFSAEKLEYTTSGPVVQYRGEIMPLLYVGQMLGTRPSLTSSESPTLKVVVYSMGERNYGLVVDRIVDIVDDQVQPDRRGRRPGVMGSVVLQKRVTDFLDIESLVGQAGLADYADEVRQ